MAPGITAYLYYRHPQWLGTATTNKGELLQSLILVPAMTSNNKWRLLLWSPDDCSITCLNQLDKLARIRLALGRRLYEVEQWLILEDNSKALPKSLEASLKEQDIHLLRLSHEQRQSLAILKPEAQVFIANPNNYLVLSYAPAANSQDIFHDLKQLLSTAEKSG
ncbi:hypothetical protein [Legionella tunisiensis]|uniref:hypothetical protein n=1 Tax=Legionella tunisiensis TaxID=1034944 RepID=UPI0002FB48C3|nr:hypothetical protein [Legionella tunisiensis]